MLLLGAMLSEGVERRTPSLTLRVGGQDRLCQLNYPIQRAGTVNWRLLRPARLRFPLDRVRLEFLKGSGCGIGP